ncbi:MAG: heme lyase CcmF/NrfE family subunit [Mycobacteriales bacterium]
MRYLLGPAGLTLGLLFTLAATPWWVLAARRGPTSAAARQARVATQGALLAAVVAVIAMVNALVQHDFAVRYVAENGGRAVPTYYTVISLWAALEGSLLLWLLVLTAVTVVAMVRVHPRAGDLHPWAMAVLSSVGAFFFGLALFAGNAFERVSPVPADGPGPNPLLQDHPLMGVHPPLLYLGYVSLTVPFAYAIAALITGRTGPAWVTVVRGWTLTAWTFLTAGVVMGGWWAYEVLGWGGYWGWDPVENVSILPWLTATALLHSIMVQKRRATLRLWNLVLAIATFVLVLFGTFLTRSGVIQSVHAFSQSTIGPVLLGYLLIVLLAVGALFVWRADRLRDEDALLATVSRETAFLGNNLLLAGLAFTILLGTVFPLLVEAVTGDRLSVGAPYFNRMAVPLALLVVLLMGIGPLLPWGRAYGAQIGRRLLPATAVGLLTLGTLGATGVRGVSALITFGLAAFVVAATATRVVLDIDRVRSASPVGAITATGRTLGQHRRTYGGLLVHLGFVLAAVAVAASSTYTASATQPLTVGQSVAVGDWTATLEGVRSVPSERRDSVVADLRLRRSGQDVGVYQPALSTYPRLQQAVGTPSVRTGLTEDAYLVLTQLDASQSVATVRLAVNPLVLWLWLAVGVMVTGAVLAGWPRRRRRHAEPDPEHSTVPAAELVRAGA